ncbi:hypothetical protein ACFLR2_00745, partial [Chlamydiota bacterium]
MGRITADSVAGPVVQPVVRRDDNREAGAPPTADAVGRARIDDAAAAHPAPATLSGLGAPGDDPIGDGAYTDEEGQPDAASPAGAPAGPPQPVVAKPDGLPAPAAAAPPQAPITARSQPNNGKCAKITILVLKLLAVFIGTGCAVVGAFAIIGTHTTFAPQFMVIIARGLGSPILPYALSAAGGTFLLGITGYAIYLCCRRPQPDYTAL